MDDTRLAALAAQITVGVIHALDASPVQTPAVPAATEAESAPATLTVKIDKAATNAELGVIYGKGSSLSTDKQGDAVLNDYELEKAAITFMENHISGIAKATRTHKAHIPGKFVASWVQDSEWLIGFKPDDQQVVQDAKDGKIVGFSMGGLCNME